MTHTPHNPDHGPGSKVTIEQIAAVASGAAGSDLAQAVIAAAARDPHVGKVLTSFTHAVAAMRGDAAFEPPVDAVQRAKQLGARLAPRRAAQRHPLAVLGEAFDRAGAVVLEWINPDNGLALAGVRDDRGADLFEAVVASAQITIRAERTTSQNGIVRLVGEITRDDDMPIKAVLAVLDCSGIVLSTDSTDSLGMFAIALPRDSFEVVVSASAPDGTVHPTIVLPLGPDSPMNTRRGGSSE